MAEGEKELNQRIMLAEKFIPDENSDCIKFRKVMPDDIMILFRSRSPLYYEIIEQLNRQHLPTQGADRVILNNDISINLWNDCYLISVNDSNTNRVNANHLQIQNF